jgi:hypothetical protein
MEKHSSCCDSFQPLRRPSAIWWKMPDGRRVFVYLGHCYPNGHFFFDPVQWRRGPSPHAGETRYRPPRAGDFLASDEASVRKAHRYLLGRLRTLEAAGYRHPTLLLPIPPLALPGPNRGRVSVLRQPVLAASQPMSLRQDARVAALGRVPRTSGGLGGGERQSGVACY